MWRLSGWMRPMHLPRLIRLPCDGEEGLVLGRAAECDVQLDSLKHLTMVSRRHCRIRAKRGVPNAWTVEDLGSANGTAVNGKRLCASKRVCVSSGDRIVLGSRGLSEAVYCVEVRGGAG